MNCIDNQGGDVGISSTRPVSDLSRVIESNASRTFY